MKAVFVYGMPANSRYALLKGPLRAWLQENGIPAQWSPSRRGWYLRTERVGDAIARAERDGFRIHMKGAVE